MKLAPALALVVLVLGRGPAHASARPQPHADTQWHVQEGTTAEQSSLQTLQTHDSSEDPSEAARGARYRPLPSLREQDALERGWVKKRHEYVPRVLRKYGYDAWLLSMREYAEDTAFRSLVPSTTVFSARRRTLILFHSGENPGVANPVYLVDNTESLWATLNATLHKLDPGRIAVNTDPGVAFADGLHSGEGRVLVSHLEEMGYGDCVSSSRLIPVEVIAARVGGAQQLREYKRMMENVWAMIAEGFSGATIVPGMTPTDLEWWFRDVIRWRLGVGTWFHPSVDIARAPSEPSVDDHPAFRAGDMVHVDIGIVAMGMHTDTQHLGYILRSNETSPPRGLVRGLRDANRMQDIVREEMVPGRTGDDVFFAAKKRMRTEGVEGDVYSHPIGDYGHSAGAVIGMTNIQGAVPDLGTLPILEDYWTSIELAARTYVPEWGTHVSFALEEDVAWDAETGSFEWVFARQERFHLVRVGHDEDGNEHEHQHQQEYEHGDSQIESSVDQETGAESWVGALAWLGL